MGNLDALRDWGHARDYVRMQWLMLQQQAPEDFVIATGQQISVRDFITCAATALGMALRWQGQGLDEVGVWTNPPHGGERTVVRIDPRYFRPAEVQTLLGDPTRAREKLGWVPETSLDALIAEMAAADLELARRAALLKQHGYASAPARED